MPQEADLAARGGLGRQGKTGPPGEGWAPKGGLCRQGRIELPEVAPGGRRGRCIMAPVRVDISKYILELFLNYFFKNVSADSKLHFRASSFQTFLFEHFEFPNFFVRTG